MKGSVPTLGLSYINTAPAAWRTCSSDMFLLFRPPLDRRFIDAGRVSCPLRAGDVDVDRCASCPWLAGFDHGSRTPSIRCRPDFVPAGFPHQPF
jgi:hypothetical protein